MEKADDVSLIIKVSSGSCGCFRASQLICWLTYRSARNLFIPFVSLNAKNHGVLQGSLPRIYVIWKHLQPRDNPSCEFYLQTEGFEVKPALLLDLCMIPL